MLDRNLRVIGHHDHRVLLQEPLDAAAGIHHTGELQISQSQRMSLTFRTVLV